jgi:hypothetical protein
MASPYRIWPWLAGMLTLVAVTPLAQAAPSACEASGSPERALVSESYRIASDTPGIELYVRNKRPAQAKGFPSERILLYVHGATYPSETAFDLPLAASPGWTTSRVAASTSTSWICGQRTVDAAARDGSSRR